MTGRLALLTARALCATLDYQVTIKLLGFNHVRTELTTLQSARRAALPGTVSSICRAVNLAGCFYFKPVLCLQKSAVTVRLLRKSGVKCHLVIGYRLSPFVSHCWVELADGTVVNDSNAYKRHFRVLSRM